MKKSALLLSAGLLLASSALADQKATITCVGEKVVLTEKSPYLGENSQFSQSLFILSLKDSKADDSANTAYFLDVDVEGDVDRNSMIWTVGKNSQGGHFILKTQFWKDQSDRTVINEETVGLLTYHHGPLKGVSETVHCVRR